jgi:hypothetical protein
MAGTTQDKLLESFSEAAGGLMQNLDSLTNASEGLAPVGNVGSPGNGNPLEPTAARSVNSSGSSSTSGGGGGTDALSIATTVLESGLGIVPLVAGLIGLFTGGGSGTPPPLVKYAMPDKIQYEGADAGGISAADYDQTGMPREFSGTPAGIPSAGAPSTAVSGSGSSGAAGPQIQVTVQAMDAQSFMDRSSDIAQAVRSAMLNLSAINDVVNDL